MHDLTALGWDDVLAEQFEPHARAGLIPGRVAVQHRGAYDVLTTEGELREGVRAIPLVSGSTASGASFFFACRRRRPSVGAKEAGPWHDRRLAC